MLKKTPLALALAAAIALPGCGGSDDKTSATDKPAADSGQAVQQDAEAKSNARNLATYLESCFAENGSYEPCALAEDGTVGGQDAGLDDPAAATTEVTAAGYTVTLKSESGNSFVIAKADSGAMERTCTTAANGGCAADGTW
jgi:hypothetical protein